mmetsp:Transcript_34643/g.79789  ORF Transcript_34643/g.79789 Transcript_34643/m.79789 type:complete len:587 (-) Transcript_34643:137-1897(-)
MDSFMVDGQIQFSGSALLRTPGRSSNRTDLEKDALATGLPPWPCNAPTVQLTAASAVSMLPHFQEPYSKKSPLQLPQQPASLMPGSDVERWQANARKLMDAYVASTARLVLKVAFVSWAAGWERFPDIDVVPTEVHEKAPPVSKEPMVPCDDFSLQEELSEAQGRAMAAERRVRELEEQLLRVSGSVPSEPPTVVQVSQASSHHDAVRLLRKLAAYADGQMLASVVATWRLALRGREAPGRQASFVDASLARDALLAWFQHVHEGVVLETSALRRVGCPTVRGGTLALRALLSWRSAVPSRPNLGPCVSAGSPCAEDASAGPRMAFFAWNLLVSRSGVRQMRAAKVAEARWKRSVTTSLAWTSWRHHAKQSARIRLSLCAKALAFQRLVLGAWRLALPDLQPGATPPRTRMLRPRTSPPSAQPNTTKLVVSPEDKAAGVEDAENTAAQGQNAPATLLQQLHVHATRLLREKIRTNGDEPVGAIQDEVQAADKDGTKTHPKCAPTPTKDAGPRQPPPPRFQKTDPAEDQVPVGRPKPPPRNGAEPRGPARGKGRISPRPGSQPKVAQSRLRLSELQATGGSPTTMRA